MSATAGDRAADIHAALTKLCDSDQVSGCALMTSQGLLVDHVLPADVVRPVGAAASAAWTHQQQLAWGVGLGTEVHESLVVSPRGMVVTRAVSAHRLVVVAPPGATLALVRIAADAAVASLEATLGAPER